MTYARFRSALVTLLAVTVGFLLAASPAQAQTPSLIGDLNVGSVGSLPTEFVPINDNGTQVLVFVATGDNASGSFIGRELWKTDGTAAGTQLVRDFRGGSSSSSPQELVVMNNVVYFACTSGTAGREICRSDGTESGTTLLKDINPGLNDSRPTGLTVVGNQLFFFADNGTTGLELWVSDGTEVGTRLVQDIYPGPTPLNRASSGFNISLDNRFAGTDDTFYFMANDGTTGLELWASDGTSAGTRVVEEIEPGSSGPQQLRQFTTLGNQLVFETQVGSGEREVWISDGTAAGTGPADGTINGVNGSGPQSITTVGDEVFFFGDYEIGGNFFTGLYTYSTAGGVQRVVDDIRTGPGDASIAAFGSNRALLEVLNETTFLYETWITDGSTAGTSKISDARPDFERVNATGIEGNMTPVQVGANLYFQAETSADGAELWRTDGTSAGTELVQNFGAGTADADLTDLAVLNGNELIFGAIDATTGNELWRIEEPPSVFVANPVPDETVVIGQEEVISLSDVFDAPPGATISYSATSQDNAIATVRVANALEEAIVEGVTEGVTAITVSITADGQTVSDSFDVTVVRPFPSFSMEVRLGTPDEVCSDPSDVNTCGALSSARRDTLLIGPTETALVRYILRNESSEELFNAEIEDDTDGVVATASSLAAGDSLVVNRFVQAPTQPGIALRLVSGSLDEVGGRRQTRRDVIGFDVPAPRIDFRLRIGRAREVCTDLTDATSCQFLSDARRDTVETWARDTAVVQVSVRNFGDADVELTELTIESGVSVLPPVGDRTLTPGDSIVVNRIVEVPSTPGFNVRVARGTVQDAGGNEDVSLRAYAFEVQLPVVRFDARIGRASEECADVNDIATCGVIGSPSRDTIAVAPSERVLVRYVIRNPATPPIRLATITNDLYGPVVTDTSVNVTGGDSLVVNRLYDAPSRAGFAGFLTEAIIEDAGGNRGDANRDFIALETASPDVQIDARLRRAEEVCSDVTDPQTCGVIGRIPDSLAVGPTEPVHVRYTVRNTSSLNTITQVTINDTYGGTVLQDESVSIAPGDTLIVRRIYDAPSDPGVTTALVRLDALDNGGNETSAVDGIGYDVFAPRINLNVVSERASEACTDVTDVATCGIISRIPDTLAVGAAQDVLVRYVVRNFGDAPIATLDITDGFTGAVVANDPVSLAPGDSVIYNRIFSAPSQTGFTIERALATGVDQGGNSDVDFDAYAFEVEAPRISLDARIDLASNACTDPSDVSTCSPISSALPDTLAAVPPGTPYLVRYVVRNQTNRVVLDDITITDEDQGTVVQMSTAGLSPGDTLAVNRLYTATGVAGLDLSRVDAIATDAGGNSARRLRAYAVQGTGPQFRPVILVGPASIFCADPDDLSTCSRARLKRMQSNPELAQRALAKNGIEREAVLYGFINTGTESFTRHTVVDNVSGTVLADEPITVAPLDSTEFFRIYDEVAAIGDQRTVTWTAVTADGDVLTNGSASEPLPVELASFGAAVAGRDVTLEWITATEENNAGFEVQRFDRETESWTALAFVEGAGTTNEAKTYRYPVGALEPDVHQFRLRQVDVSGRFALSQPIEATVMIDGPFRLTDIAPHPVRGTGDLSLTVREPQSVRVEIYDLLGRRVASVLDDELTAGKQHSMTLDASRLSSGVYFLRVVGETFATTQRVSVVR